MLAAAITLASPLASQAAAAQQIDSLAIVRFKMHGANDGRSGGPWRGSSSDLGLASKSGSRFRNSWQ